MSFPLGREEAIRTVTKTVILRTNGIQVKDNGYSLPSSKLFNDGLISMKVNLPVI